jgi:CheY-like chemotaxis protein
MKEGKVEQRLHIQNTLIDSNSVSFEQVPVQGLPVQLHKHRILCVDDEIPGTRMRGEVLREHGYSVVLYHCPLAVLHCDLSMFDLAILDFEMPGLNGRELFLRMRALGARFPIVLLTGCLEALSHEDARMFARCIDKGMPIHYLLDTIAEVLEPNQVPDYGL